MSFVGCRLLVLAVVVCAGCAAPSASDAPAAPTSAAGANGTTIVAVAPPAAPQQTLLDFLGVTQIGAAVQQCETAKYNCLAKAFPNVFPTTDLGDLTSTNPAVGTNEAIKQDEAAAPAKIQALQELSKVGCSGRYPDVEKSILASLDDPTESVRFAAAKAFKDAAGSPCGSCKANSCCSERVREKLRDVAFGLTKVGCYKEESVRVRRMARLALRGCGPPPAIAVALPTEGPQPDPLPATGPELGTPAKATPTGGNTPPPGPDAPTTSAVERRGDVVLATVNGHRIYGHEIAEELRDRADLLPKSLSSAEREATLVDFVRERTRELVEVELLRQAESESGADPVELAVHVEDETDVSVEEVSAWIEANPKYRMRAEAVRWERVIAGFDDFDSVEEARAALDEVRLAIARRPNEADARATKLSQGLRAENVDWTTPDEITAPALATAVFDGSVGELSEVVETPDSLQLIRVLERRDREDRERLLERARRDLLADRDRRLREQVVAELWSKAEVETLFGASVTNRDSEPSPSAID